MGLQERRHARQRERREFGSGGVAARYRVPEGLLTSGDGWIHDDHGHPVVQVDATALDDRRTLDLLGTGGVPVCRIRTQVTHGRDTIAVEQPDGRTLATVRRVLVGRTHQPWWVDVVDGPDLVVDGDVVDHEYDLAGRGRKVAEASRRWLPSPEAYGVQVASDADPLLVLAVAVALDATRLA